MALGLVMVCCVYERIAKDKLQMFNQLEIIYFKLIPGCDSYKARFCYNTSPHLIRYGLYAGFIYMA